MKFVIQDNLDDDKILGFILRDERASIYHHPAWLKALKRTFGYKVYYLITYIEENKIEGLVPFLTSKSLLTGKRIITLPFSTYCDPLINYENLTDAIDFLRKEFPEFDTIDIRSLNNLDNYLTDFEINSDYCTHILKLKNSVEETFELFRTRSVKARLRKTEKQNYYIDWENSYENLNVFYKLEFNLRRRLLLPPIPYNFFKNAYEELLKCNLVSLPVIYNDNIPVAAGFILNFKDKYYLEYTASDKKYLNFYPNHKLFFEVIKKAHLAGAKYVDFGRTNLENTSLITFKENWAAEKYPVFHHISPKQRLIKKGNTLLKKTLMNINAVLPDFILKLEGNLIYKHML